MATLQNIRNRGGVLVGIIIGLALLAFIVGDALSSGSAIFGDRTKLGEVNGDEISIMDYQKKLNNREEMLKMESGTATLTEEQQNSLRDQVWQEMVSTNILNSQFDEIGLGVGDDELYDLVYGEDMSPVLVQMFSNPQTGELDKEQVRTIVKNIVQQPANSQYKVYWLNKEKEIALNRLSMKYGILLEKSLFITDAEVERNIEDKVNTKDISYISKSYNTISDSTISVSKSEIASYYDAHRNSYKQTESRNIAYANFDIVPSAQDELDTKAVASQLINEFATTSDPKEFVGLSSDVPFNSAYLKNDSKDIADDSLRQFAFSGSDDVFGPYYENQSYKIARVVSRASLPDSVRARHILIQNPNHDAAMKTADSIVSLIKAGQSFDELARKLSTDQGSSVNGGDLSWFAQGQMVKPFDDSVFFGKKNKLMIVTSQFGVHIVEKTDMTKPIQKVQLAIITKEVNPSSKTINEINNQARLFASGVTTLDDFTKKIDEMKITRRNATVSKNDKEIAGLQNSRELVRRIYLSEDQNSVVRTSEGSVIFDNGNAYTVAVLTNIKEEGFAPVGEVYYSIQRILMNKKKAEILKKELANSISGSNSLASVAQKAGLEVKDAADISYASLQIPGAGIEPVVIATAMSSAQGAISDPIEGNSGVYVLMVNSENKGDTNIKAQVLNELSQGNRYRVGYQAMNSLYELAKVKDLRYKFY